MCCSGKTTVQPFWLQTPCVHPTTIYFARLYPSFLTVGQAAAAAEMHKAPLFLSCRGKKHLAASNKCCQQGSTTYSSIVGKPQRLAPYCRYSTYLVCARQICKIGEIGEAPCTAQGSQREEAKGQRRRIPTLHGSPVECGPSCGGAGPGVSTPLPPLW